MHGGWEGGGVGGERGNGLKQEGEVLVKSYLLVLGFERSVNFKGSPQDESQHSKIFYTSSKLKSLNRKSV